MTSTTVSSIRPGRTAERNALFAPALYVSIFVTIFAVVTQCLDAAGAISVSTTQQLTMWLVVAGLIVLLWISYMACHAYVTVRSSEEARVGLQTRADKAEAEAERARTAAVEADVQRDEALAAKAIAEQAAKSAQEQLAQALRDIEQQKDRAEKAEAEAEQARAAAVKASEERAEALAGRAVAEQAAKTAQEQLAQALRDIQQQKDHAGKAGVESGPGYARQHEEPPKDLTDGSDQFSLGGSKDGSAGEDEDAWLPPKGLMHLDGTERSVSTATLFPDGCYLEPDSIKPVEDKLTGRHEYQCRVVDLNPALKDRSHETVINILASQEPSPSPMPRFGLVKFDDLKITPYVTDQNPMRIRYSLRATGIHPAAPTAVERVQAVWTAPGSPEDVTSGKAGDGMLKDVLAQILETLGVDVVEGIIQGFVS